MLNWLEKPSSIPGKPFEGSSVNNIIIYLVCSLWSRHNRDIYTDKIVENRWASSIERVILVIRVKFMAMTIHEWYAVHYI